ncbi:hypothetical protein [Acaryochloris sp. CCMEE 5410]|uniref:hypothetical protein n=1 Tax=Acaryochloris sp. CCMEE 5410 TaxID=310037 RepID=UPI0021CE5FE8|nr:hypothetical protein [Acaryochloris sp. CCMEE 5410]
MGRIGSPILRRVLMEFISSRQSLGSLFCKEQIDGWTRDRAVAAQAAVEWIKIIGAEENVDLMAAIERGDFALADRVLSPLQWTSLPGGPEQSEVWSNPANFENMDRLEMLPRMSLLVLLRLGCLAGPVR